MQSFLKSLFLYHLLFSNTLNSYYQLFTLQKEHLLFEFIRIKLIYFQDLLFNVLILKNILSHLRFTKFPHHINLQILKSIYQEAIQRELNQAYPLGLFNLLIFHTGFGSYVNAPQLWIYFICFWSNEHILIYSSLQSWINIKFSILNCHIEFILV